MSVRYLPLSTPWLLLLAVLMLGVAHQTAMAERPEPQEPRKVEFFQAMDAGEIDVKFLPKSSAAANLIVKNNTDQPLEIRLPEAFAGVPANFQMGMGMGGGMGGMGGMGMGGGMGGMGMGGMMRVAPEKTRKLGLTTVCLEHGKPDPRPRMAYKIVPLEAVVSDDRVVELCRLLGYGKVAQNTAQAAAWHLTDSMSWGELAAKNRIESKYTGNTPYFVPIELQQAMTVVGYVTGEAKGSRKQRPNGADGSLAEGL